MGQLTITSVEGERNCINLKFLRAKSIDLLNASTLEITFISPDGITYQFCLTRDEYRKIEMQALPWLQDIEDPY